MKSRLTMLLGLSTLISATMLSGCLSPEHEDNKYKNYNYRTGPDRRAGFYALRSQFVDNGYRDIAEKVASSFETTPTDVQLPNAVITVTYDEKEINARATINNLEWSSDTGKLEVFYERKGNPERFFTVDYPGPGEANIDFNQSVFDRIIREDQIIANRYNYSAEADSLGQYQAGETAQALELTIGFLFHETNPYWFSKAPAKTTRSLNQGANDPKPHYPNYRFNNGSRSITTPKSSGIPSRPGRSP